MANVLRADLERLLRARQLDRTLIAPDAAPAPLDDRYVVATGIGALDERLLGGLPRGQMSELVGPRSSGRTSLLLGAMAGVTARGELAALVDTLDRLDPASAAASGVDLRRLLWVRGHGEGTAVVGTGGWSDGREAPIDRALDQAIKAVNLVLQGGGFSLVALDLADVPPAALTRLPFTTWRRLQRVIEGSSTACVLVASEQVARSAGGVSVLLRGTARWNGSPSVPESHRGSQRESAQAGAGETGANVGARSSARLLTGLDIEAEIQRARPVGAERCRFALRARD